MNTSTFDLISHQLGYFSIGALYTLGLTSLSIFFGLAIAMVISVGRIIENRIINILSSSYVDVMRGIPFLVLIIWVYYGVSILFDISFSPLFAGVACLALKYSGYLAETIRAGIQAIEKGQEEAAFALGFSKAQIWRRIIIPQAMRIVFPALGNSFVSMIQDSSVVMIVGVWELMRRGNSVANSSMKPFEIYSMVAVYYLIMSVAASRILRYIERKIKINR